MVLTLCVHQKCIGWGLFDSRGVISQEYNGGDMMYIHSTILEAWSTFYVR